MRSHTNYGHEVTPVVVGCLLMFSKGGMGFSFIDVPNGAWVGQPCLLRNPMNKNNDLPIIN